MLRRRGHHLQIALVVLRVPGNKVRSIQVHIVRHCHLVLLSMVLIDLVDGMLLVLLGWSEGSVHEGGEGDLGGGPGEGCLLEASHEVLGIGQVPQIGHVVVGGKVHYP